MIKCEVIKEFTLGESDEFRFEDLKNIQRRRLDTKGKLYYGDTFECTKEMADYLMGDNKDKKVVVKVIEVKPEIKILSQSPIEELEKAINVKAEITTTKPKKKKSSKK